MGATSRPGVKAQLSGAGGTIGADPFRIMINGQIGAGGIAVDGQTYKDISDITNDEVKTLFGANSDLTNRILKVRDIADGQYEIWVIAKGESGTGVTATLDLAYAGTATEDKLMVVKPVSGNEFSFNVSIENGDSDEIVAGKVKAGLDLLADTFPVANALATATLTLTSSDKGTLGNDYTVEHQNIPAGITINTNAVYSRDQFSSGANDPVFTGIFDNVQATRFHVILWPWANDFKEPQDLLSDRNVINNQFLQGSCFIGLDGTEAEIKAKVNGTTPMNDQNIFFMGNRVESGASVFVEPSNWRVAEFAAIEGVRLTPNTLISQYVTVDTPLDNVGGTGIASLAYYNTPLANTQPVDPDLLFDEQEQTNLKDDGYTIIGVNPAKTNTIMADVVSTYKFDSKGNPDVSFKFLNYIRTGYYALELFFKTMKSTYSQFRLTDGAVIAGRAMANKGSIEAKYKETYKILSGADYTLTQAGDEVEEFFYDQLSVDLDIAQGLTTSSGKLPIVTQSRDFIMTFQMSFTTGG